MLVNFIFRMFFLCVFNFPLLAMAAQEVGLGHVAKNLLEPVSLISEFVATASMVIGTIFLFASIIKYIEHRRSPLMVPISTVIFLFIAGLVLIFLPIVSMFSEGTITHLKS